jgi:hypothetical protein
MKDTDNAERARVHEGVAIHGSVESAGWSKALITVSPKHAPADAISLPHPRSGERIRCTV